MGESLKLLDDISADAVVRRREESERWISAAYSPGRAVLITCVFINFLVGPVILMLVPALNSIVGEDLLLVAFDLLFVPILLAQATMVAIWLGIIVPILYWLALGGLGVPIVGGMVWGNVRVDPEFLLILFYPLPFAVASVLGVELRQLAVPNDTQPVSQMQFSLYRLFYWTFVAAAAFAVLRILPIQVDYPELLVLFALGVVIGFLSVVTVLRPGAHRFAFLYSVCVSALLGLATSMVFKLRIYDSLAVIGLAALQCLCLVGLLTFYRRAGYRAVWRRGYYPEQERKPVRTPVNPLAD